MAQIVKYQGKALLTVAFNSNINANAMLGFDKYCISIIIQTRDISCEPIFNYWLEYMKNTSLNRKWLYQYRKFHCNVSYMLYFYTFQEFY